MKLTKQLTRESVRERRPTIGFICPLYIELLAVRAIFDEGDDDRPVRHDSSSQPEFYYYGRIGGRSAVAVCFAEERVGPEYAVLHTIRLLERHDSLNKASSCVFLVGIAGGIWSNRADIRLGDVVIATHVQDWRSGKLVSGHNFEPSEHLQDVADEVGFRLPKFRVNPERWGQRILKLIENMRNVDECGENFWIRPDDGEDVLFEADVQHQEGKRCENCEQRMVTRAPRNLNLPQLHKGCIATGNVVLKDALIREKLSEQLKVLAVEMEASAVLKARKNLVIIRGISDYADSHKNKRWQHFAAAAAAAAARMWIDDLEPALSEEGADNEPASPTLRRDASFYGSDTSEDDVCDINSCSIDLQRSRDQSTASSHEEVGDQGNEQWCPSLIVADSAITLKISDGSPSGKEVVHSWSAAKVVVELLQSSVERDNHRRLKIIDSQNSKRAAHSVWLPHTGITVNQEGSQLDLRFSNCNQRAKKMSGQFQTKNGRASYHTVYDPATPNVTLKIETSGEEGAVNLSRLILSSSDHDSVRKHGSDSNGLSEWDIRHSSILSEVEEKPTIFVWTKKPDGTELDIGCFSRSVDFEIQSRSDQHFLVSLGFMRKHQYIPQSTQTFSSEPPSAVKKNHDGRPRHTEHAGEDSLNSRLDLSVDFGQVCEVLNTTISTISSYQMQAFALDVKVSAGSKGRKFGWKSESPIAPGQISIWVGNDEVRLLILDSQCRESKHRRWMACTGLTNSCVMGNNQSELLLDNIDFVEGHLLSAETFLPVQNNDEGTSNPTQAPTDKRSITLIFSDSDNKSAFERSLREFLSR